MKTMWQGGSMFVLALAIIAATMFVSNTEPRVHGNAPGAAGGMAGAPHYTVIETQGFNLLVTDNSANKLYYYATDKDAPVGSPLKLRASLDLKQVGEKEITLKSHNLENMRKKTDVEKK